MSGSLLSKPLTLSQESREHWLKLLAARLFWSTERARPEQLPPERPAPWSLWEIWLYLAGRGAGKTRTAAEWLAWQAVKYEKTRWAIVAPTFADGRDTCVEGESGILDILHRYGAVRAWNRSQGKIVLNNGSIIQIFSAEKPERLRGKQHHGAWCDEMAAWKYMRETWDQLMFGLRLPQLTPQVMVSTTPKPLPLIRELLLDPLAVISRGSTFDNAKNLAATQLRRLLAKYGDTQQGRQELYGEVLDDVQGALFKIAQIEGDRMGRLSPDQGAIYPQFNPREITRRLVSLDHAVSDTEDSDEHGIIIASRDRHGHAYVEYDYTMRGGPSEWAAEVVRVFDLHECDAVLVERNQGGDMVAATLRVVRPNLPIIQVTAKESKELRAEPVAIMYEQHMVSHVGVFGELETQMTTWVPHTGMDSPDRMDALVHVIAELLEIGGAQQYLDALALTCPHCQMPNIRSATSCFSCGGTLESEGT